MQERGGAKASSQSVDQPTRVRGAERGAFWNSEVGVREHCTGKGRMEAQRGGGSAASPASPSPPPRAVREARPPDLPNRAPGRRQVPHLALIQEAALEGDLHGRRSWRSGSRRRSARAQTGRPGPRGVARGRGDRRQVTAHRGIRVTAHGEHTRRIHATAHTGPCPCTHGNGTHSTGRCSMSARSNECTSVSPPQAGSLKSRPRGRSGGNEGALGRRGRTCFLGGAGWPCASQPVASLAANARAQ